MQTPQEPTEPDPDTKKSPPNASQTDPLNQVADKDETGIKPKTAIVESWEKKSLYLFFVVFLVAMFIFLGNELATQESNFRQGAALAKETFDRVAATPASSAYRPDVALLYTFQFSRALEFAHIKTAAVILGALTVCLGCMIVVYGVEASYQLTVNPRADSASSLKTSSPGLVLITLGVLIIVVAQLTQSRFDTTVDWVLPTIQTNPISTEVPSAHQFPTPKNS